jgi:hypothetical protein
MCRMTGAMQPSRVARPNFVMITEHWPVVLTRVTGDLSDADCTALCEQWRTIFAKQETVVCITDAREARNRPSPKQRAMFAELGAALDAQIRKHSLGHATVVENALIRSVMTAVGWLYKPPVPQPFFTTMDDAWAWAEERLKSYRAGARR